MNLIDMPINYTQLLTSILSKQQVIDDLHEMDQNRIKLIATGESKATFKEQAILLRSPRLRDKLLNARKAFLSEFSKVISQQHNLSILPLAASSAYQDETIIKNEDFTVCLYQNKPGYGIVIQIILEPELFNKLKPDMNIRLIDSGGLEWIIGRPDENGELVSLWDNIDIDLKQRISRYELNLEFS